MGREESEDVWNALKMSGLVGVAVIVSSVHLGCAVDDVAKRCPEGKIWEAGECVDYVVDAPVIGAGVWRPSPGTSWQWQLSGAVDTSLAVEMYDVDLFDVEDVVLESLRQDGRIVVCYFSAGSWEAWRDDANRFPRSTFGEVLEGWEDERWIDIRDETVRTIMLSRLDLAVDRGCDGVEPDNVDGYANRNGLGLNPTEQLDYNRFIANAAHERGLSVGLKNDLDQVDALLPWFDWALNEECVAYGECSALSSFLQAEKAVFHVEYVDDWEDSEELAERVCGATNLLDTLVKTWELGPEYRPC